MTDTPTTDQLEKAERVPVSLGIVVSTIDEAWRLAKAFAASALVPKDYRDRPENVLVAMQLGAELGLAPMAAVQSIAVVNGRPTLYGDGLLAVIMASTLYVDHREYYEVKGNRRDGLTVDDMALDDTAAVCSFWRVAQAEPTTRRFTIAQAKTAKLWGKDGPWSTFPDRMLRMRARSWAARDTFADLLKGLRAAEEIEDDPEPPPARVARLSDFTDRTPDLRPTDPDPKDAA